MKDFKVGDKVRIREWEDMEKEFGMKECDGIKCKYWFTPDMKHLSGRTATIKEVDEDRVKLKDWSDISGNTIFTYSADMLEKVEEEINMNKMAEVAKLFGVELNEEFDIEDSRFNPQKFTLDGLEDCDGDKSDWIHNLFTGGMKIIKRPWRPQKGERYWSVNGNGYFASYFLFNADASDYKCMKTNNCFKTREEAEANIERIKAEKEEFFAYVK